MSVQVERATLSELLTIIEARSREKPLKTVRVKKYKELEGSIVTTVLKDQEAKHYLIEAGKKEVIERILSTPSPPLLSTPFDLLTSMQCEVDSRIGKNVSFHLYKGEDVKADKHLGLLHPSNFILIHRIEASLDKGVPALGFSCLPCLQAEPVKAIPEDLRKAVQEAKVIEAESNKGYTPLEELFLNARELTATSWSFLGEPVFVLVKGADRQFDNHYFYIIWAVCRELYREVMGGYPEPIVYLDWNWKRKEEGELLWLRIHGYASGRIMIFDVREKKPEDFLSLFERKLVECFSQGLGYVIVLMDKGEADEYGFKFKVKERASPFTPLIVELQPRPEARYNIQGLTDLLAKSFCLSVKDLDDLFEQGYFNLDHVVSRAERLYRDSIKKLLKDPSNHRYLTKLRRSRHDGQGHENDEHLAMKLTTIKHLHEELHIPLNHIKCEESRDGRIVDVFVDGYNIEVECETLIGVGPMPVLKLFDVVDRREKKSNPSELWIVVRNWAAFLHLGEIYWAMNVLRDDGRNVRFFIPCFSKGRLIELEKLWEDVRRIT